MDFLTRLAEQAVTIAYNAFIRLGIAFGMAIGKAINFASPALQKSAPILFLSPPWLALIGLTIVARKKLSGLHAVAIGAVVGIPMLILYIAGISQIQADVAHGAWTAATLDTALLPIFTIPLFLLAGAGLGFLIWRKRSPRR